MVKLILRGTGRWNGRASGASPGVESPSSAKPPGGECAWRPQVVKEIVRGLVGQDVARAVIDLLLDLTKALQSDLCEIITFWKILPDQTVVVLHPAFFPRSVGFTEIAFAFQQLVNPFMHRKLEAIVVGDAVDLHPVQDGYDSFHGSRAAFIGQQVQLSDTAFALID